MAQLFLCCNACGEVDPVPSTTRDGKAPLEEGDREVLCVHCDHLAVEVRLLESSDDWIGGR